MYTQFYYKKKADGSICLLRCFGENSQVTVPEEISGCPVTEIGAYCFAQNHRLQGMAYEKTMLPDEENAGSVLAEQAGRAITQVNLPDTVRQIGAYAFYNCRCLKSLTLPGDIREVGNDAFMNCTSLKSMVLRSGIHDRTGLYLILTQISWGVEVAIGPEEQDPQAVLLYPEYQEYYDELGPVHIFELHVAGEGFRARKCFRDRVLLLQEYDGIFTKVSVEESPAVACRMALDRILWPAELSETNRAHYEEFIRGHDMLAAGLLFSDEEKTLQQRLDCLHRLFEQKLLSEEVLGSLLTRAASQSLPEAAAAMIAWKRSLFTRKKKNRYEF